MNNDYCLSLPKIYKLLGFKGGKIPLGYSFIGSMEIPVRWANVRGPDKINPTLTLNVVVYPSRGKKHRIYVDCPCCAAKVPAGRLHQHIGSRTTCKPLETV